MSEDNNNFSINNLKNMLRFTMPLGMISSIAFFTMIILGQALWKGYNPITSFVSELTADGSPNVMLMRVISNISYIGLLIFASGMTVLSFIKYRPSLRFGYSALLIMALTSIVGFDAFPMTIERIFSVQNTLHIIITSAIICITVIATFFISNGYLKCNKLLTLGRISLILAILFTIFNLALLLAMLKQSNIVGLIQRLSILTFYIHIFVLSCMYTSKFDKVFNSAA